MSVNPTDRVFQLQPYGSTRGAEDFQCIVVVPESVSPEIATAAWSNAVRYTAKGLDLPDHEAAIQRLQKRHPSWIIIRSLCYGIGIDLRKADNDVPDNQ